MKEHSLTLLIFNEIKKKKLRSVYDDEDDEKIERVCGNICTDKFNQHGAAEGPMGYSSMVQVSEYIQNFGFVGKVKDDWGGPKG